MPAAIDLFLPSGVRVSDSLRENLIAGWEDAHITALPTIPIKVTNARNLTPSPCLRHQILNADGFLLLT
jgi:hypothetical protein